MSDDKARPEGSRVAQAQAQPPPHPYWCDDCDGKAQFRIFGCPIEHEEGCPRFGEDATAVYLAAIDYVRTTGRPIP